MTTTDLHMANGEHLVVAGTLEDVEKVLSDASRSGQSRLGWLTDAGTNTPVGVNPAQVSTIRAAAESG